jgi:hypothetical protein
MMTPEERIEAIRKRIIARSAGGGWWWCMFCSLTWDNGGIEEHEKNCPLEGTNE